MILKKNKSLLVIILAAGKGTRMPNNTLPKVLYPLYGIPLVNYSINLAKKVVPNNQIIMIIGYKANFVKQKIIDIKGINFVKQNIQLGTAHAIMQAYKFYKNHQGDIIILYGDVPLLTLKTLKQLLQKHIEEKSLLTILTAIREFPDGYGRIIRNSDNNLINNIIEDKDTSFEEKKIKEINTGILCIDSQFLSQEIHNIKNNNYQQEYYLTDIIKLAVKKKIKINSITTFNKVEIMGINTIDDLEFLENFIKNKFQKNCF